MLIVNYFVSLNQLEENTGRVERGFSSLSKSGTISSSLQFYFILVVFILFEIELLVIFGVCYRFNPFLFLLFILLIIGSLLIELFFNKIR
jgi:NADH:ubiquinone oxidoreductase subunit 3 (subunit A)